MILKIKVKVKCDIFVFNEVTFQEIEQELRNLDTKKSITFNNIPPKHLRENYICSSNIMQLVNETINDCDVLQWIETVKYHPNAERKYIKRINERVSLKIVCRLLCGYMKGYNPQHVLITLIEKWKRVLMTKNIRLWYLWICLRRLKL